MTKLFEKNNIIAFKHYIRHLSFFLC